MHACSCVQVQRLNCYMVTRECNQISMHDEWPWTSRTVWICLHNTYMQEVSSGRRRKSQSVAVCGLHPLKADIVLLRNIAGMVLFCALPTLERVCIVCQIFGQKLLCVHVSRNSSPYNIYGLPFLLTCTQCHRRKDVPQLQGTYCVNCNWGTSFLLWHMISLNTFHGHYFCSLGMCVCVGVCAYVRACVCVCSLPLVDLCFFNPLRTNDAYMRHELP